MAPNLQRDPATQSTGVSAAGLSLFPGAVPGASTGSVTWQNLNLQFVRNSGASQLGAGYPNCLNPSLRRKRPGIEPAGINQDVL